MAAGVPIPIAVTMAQQLSDNEFNLTSELMAQLEERQKENDTYTNRKRELELELLEAQIKNTNMPPASPAAGSGDKNKKGHSYSDKLEQKKHEKVGEGRTQNIAAVQEGKKL